jgi:hypothetical protein
MGVLRKLMAWISTGQMLPQHATQVSGAPTVIDCSMNSTLFDRSSLAECRSILQHSWAIAGAILGPVTRANDRMLVFCAAIGMFQPVVFGEEVPPFKLSSTFCNTASELAAQRARGHR